MTENSAILTQTRLVAGVWEGVLSLGTAAIPAIEVLHQGVVLEGMQTTPILGKPGYHAVRVPIPASVLSEGTQTIVFQAAGTTLAHLTIIAGVPLEDDVRAEISLLRAELDLLKRAFRRHCAEPSG